MSLARSAFLFAFLIAPLLFAGCDDPSAVGLDIIGEVGGDPVIMDVPPVITQLETAGELTGQNSRVLVGHVEDPLFGTFRTHAYLDFGAPLSGSTFREGTINSAYLRLERSYVYGDTLGSIEVDVYGMDAEWGSQGATADTSIAYSSLIASYTISAHDTLVTLQLPPDWVAANDTTLRSEAFSSVFHGFHLRARGGNAVVGYSAGLSFLGATTAADTVSFPQVRNLTVRERLTDPQPTGNVVAYQSLVGPGVALSYDTSELIERFALNRGTLRIREDSLQILLAPVNFVRTRPQTLTLFYRTVENVLLPVETAPRQDTGEFVFRSGELYLMIDRILRGQIRPGRFEIRTQQPATATQGLGINTLDVLLIRQDEGRPDLRLVLTPLLD
jgi:hypothetical protein